MQTPANDEKAPLALNNTNIEWFRKATPYINSHREKTFIIMLGGSAIEHHNLDNIINDLVLLSSLNVKLIIVHGIRQQLDTKLHALNIDSQFVHGWRVTTPEILDEAIQASSLIRAKLETRLAKGIPNTPKTGKTLRIATSNVVTAKPAGIIEGVDLQHTGLVRKIDSEAIQKLIDNGNVLLLSPIAHSPSGETFSLAYDHIASEIAKSIKADKLIIFTEKEGIYDNSGFLLRELPLHEAEKKLTSELLDQPSNHHLEAAIHALKGGVSRVHLMSFKTDGAILQELFSIDGAGTLLSIEEYETSRQAESKDIQAIENIISPLEEKNILVRRDRERLEEEISNFTIIEREGLIIAVAALYPFQNNDKLWGEIACIATHPNYINLSKGTKLLQLLEKKAIENKMSAVFVLTTQTTDWFIEKGFKEINVNHLPQEKKTLYNFQRNSKILLKEFA